MCADFADGAGEEQVWGGFADGWSRFPRRRLGRALAGTDL